MILEFCDGGSLDTKLFDPTQPMTAADQLKIVSGIAKGLYHLHKNQIVHRDMAARNILVGPKILDTTKLG
jgi:STE20-like kinase